MKFSELPKFTRQGHYQVNMPLIYLLRWIKRGIKYNWLPIISK